jgi:hypothetical protein
MIGKLRTIRTMQASYIACVGHVNPLTYAAQEGLVRLATRSAAALAIKCACRHRQPRTTR